MTLENLKLALELNNAELLKRLSHENQEVLDKFSIDEDGNVLYNGDKISASVSSETGNAIIEKPDGIYVSSEGEAVKDLQQQINIFSQYRKYLNNELEYGVFGINSMEHDGTLTGLKQGEIVLHKQRGNIDSPILKGGKKYRVFFSVGAGLMNGEEATISLRIQIRDSISNKSVTHTTLTIDDKRETHVDTNYIGKTDSWEHIIENSNDSNITITCTSYTGSLGIKPAQTKLIIQEISRNIIVDPIEHVNDQQGIEDTPVGHILSFMGNTPPKHYLFCDGTEYNILDYPYLANHIRDHFGKYNFFGGDGETTFCVPDLRGEFLRGTGQNKYAYQGSGNSVGGHQDATEHLRFGLDAYTNGGQLYFPNLSDPVPGVAHWGDNPDSSFSAKRYGRPTSSDNKGATVKLDGTYDENSGAFKDKALFTSRPTNTSVMYCIKYEPTYYFVHNTTEEVTQNITEQIVQEVSSTDYLKQHADSDTVPIGHILAYMGNNAPEHYLPCDGTVYNISKYPLLAEHIKIQFGNYKYFGGNGTTTFAVPDLRGEFLRGTGTASRNTGTGLNAGEHQDATEHIFLSVSHNHDTLVPGVPGMSPMNVDKVTSSGVGHYDYPTDKNTYNTSLLYTSRPTNTAVLYCIKAEPTYCVNLDVDSITDDEISAAILETIDILKKGE